MLDPYNVMGVQCKIYDVVIFFPLTNKSDIIKFSRHLMS